MGTINRRELAKRVALGAFLAPSSLTSLAETMQPATASHHAGGSQDVHPRWSLALSGIWKGTIGPPEKITPVGLRRFPPLSNAIKTLPAAAAVPVSVEGEITPRGCTVRLPLAQGEMVYGLGLQLFSFLQRGKKKTLRVNADPRADSGDTHAPVPFFVTTQGYGVLIDTARYATFYGGFARPHA